MFLDTDGACFVGANFALYWSAQIDEIVPYPASQAWVGTAPSGAGREWLEKQHA
jgi:hypothetical protein